MFKTKRDDPTDLLRLALIRMNERIAELGKTRAQLAALIDQPSASPEVEAAAPQKRRKLSDAAKAKIRAAVKARWARERKASASPDVEATGRKRRKLSAETREKLSAAAKARWAKERGSKAKVQMSKPAPKKAQSKAKPAKSSSANSKAKKASAKKK